MYKIIANDKREFLHKYIAYAETAVESTFSLYVNYITGELIVTACDKCEAKLEQCNYTLAAYDIYGCNVDALLARADRVVAIRRAEFVTTAAGLLMKKDNAKREFSRNFPDFDAAATFKQVARAYYRYCNIKRIDGHGLACVLHAVDRQIAKGAKVEMNQETLARIYDACRLPA